MVPYRFCSQSHPNSSTRFGTTSGPCLIQPPQHQKHNKLAIFTIWISRLHSTLSSLPTQYAGSPPGWHYIFRIGNPNPKLYLPLAKWVEWVCTVDPMQTADMFQGAMLDIRLDLLGLRGTKAPAESWKLHVMRKSWTTWAKKRNSLCILVPPSGG